MHDVDKLVDKHRIYFKKIRIKLVNTMNGYNVYNYIIAVDKLTGKPNLSLELRNKKKIFNILE